MFTVFLKNRNFISKIIRSKVTDYAALKPQLHSHNSGHDSSRLVPDGKIMVHRDASGRKKKKIQHQYGFCTIHLWIMTAALRFTAEELQMLTMPPRFDTIQAGSAAVVSRHPTNVHDLVVVMRQS